MIADRIAYGTRRGSQIPRWEHVCGNCGAHISVFWPKCKACGAEFEKDRPYIRHLTEL